MRLGLAITDFSWPGGAAEIGPRLREIVTMAESMGFSWFTVMDHYFQIIPPEERDMLDAYTALSFIAAHTKSARISCMVTGVTYRHPGLLAKTVTTLDVLSGGRAMLGIGAAWNEREHRGLGVPFPPLKERFERLEECLQICHQMWSANDGPYEGKHYQLTETMNIPQSIQRPHPPILVGGLGKPKALRLIAKYCDASNFFGSPEVLRERFAALKEECERQGRDYDSIERTAGAPVKIGDDGSGVPEALEKLRAMADAGVQSATLGIARVGEIRPLEVAGRDLVPVALTF